MPVLMCIILLSSYSVRVAVLDEFGSKVSSSNYRIWGAGGQSTIIGSSTSDAYRTRFGFFGYLAKTELGVEENQSQTLETALYRISPNPSSGPVRISYTIAERGFVSLKIYDITGRLIKVLQNGRIKSGEYNLRWNCRDVNNRQVPAGVYFYRLVVNNRPVATKKLVLVR
ncbi:T9SS type A sorting domain-containing protein [candidate division WOR-3 bacterium]|nr:T9SS type A sorting domain-containing protein [candidate division WOR-3 bacterium]